MILPMPSFPSASGPPSCYMKSKEQLTILVLVLQSVICVSRLVLLLDIMGGFIMGICVGLGWYAYKEDMNITYFCYWGMMCAFNGIFDLVKLIDFWVKSPSPLFSSAAGWQYNLVSTTLIMVPVVMIMGAVLAWYMYKSATGDESGVYEPTYGRSGAAARSSVSQSYGTPARTSFQAFGGSGQRLGQGKA
mmetsp:Transcript_14016/g.37248  ORF Transcript_14016/g.37248 Transcript_14016/m.37248 type:complete len:190 (-) Transcript_14016:79-648(-)